MPDFSKSKVAYIRFFAAEYGAPRDFRQADILNLAFKAVAFRAHQALPDGTRTTALL